MSSGFLVDQRCLSLRESLLHRWFDLCKRLGVKGDVVYHANLFRRLAYYYNHPERHYHNLVHINNCLKKFDEVKHLLDRPDSVELAIWFHDAIYEVWAEDNEDRSASLAMFFIVNLMRLSWELANWVDYLIERTKYFSKDNIYQPETEDAKYLVDIDLFSGLGGLPSDFSKKSELVAKEYGWVETDTFRKKRLEVFRMFLSRSPFYLTSYFRIGHEEQTRANLEGAIRDLKGQILPPKVLLDQTLPQGVNPDYVVLVDGFYYDLCVICKVNTTIRTDCPTGSRNFYETCGQLCRDCWNQTFLEN